MKKTITLAIILTMGLYSYAQQTYKGQIVDKTNNPIVGATITDTFNNQNGTMSDINGYFSITLQNTKEVTISLLGYISKNIILKLDTNEIKLVENNITLEEVLVSSASRETQKRSEIPGAITTLSAAKIKESKAFGIDQLVNQVPGVFMATSRAASNEQHFMAVRSPISTKALFLYLEDGLQIRPTSVFNHNALLEMNDTSYDRIEVLKGPASSIYGSESIGGSFNFITKNPTEKLSGSLGFQTNSIGLTRYDIEVSDKTNNKFGFYIGGHSVKRTNGPIAHSDYEKLAATFKTVYDFSETTIWTNVLNLINYRSDMTGSLSEQNYSNGNFESDQTFTERKAIAFRVRSSLDKFWNENNKTSFNIIIRDNRMDQNPSYRIRQFRNQGQLTGSGSGEINSNQFRSFVGLIQHKLNFGIANSSMIVGIHGDYSPQKYTAETTSIVVDIDTGQNTDFTINSGDFILNYRASILNYASFFQYEITPLQSLKITAAARYDSFIYDYNNQSEGFVGIGDSIDNFNTITPKLGFNYNITNHTGVYANYSQGFTPPQVSTLYRNKNRVQGIKPSRYDNYEIGGYFAIPSKLTIDGAIYVLEGKNTLVTMRDEDDNFYNTNAGKTRSYGIEYGITWYPIKAVSITHNGSYAKHKYVDFFDNGIEYSNTTREIAPNILGTSLITYRKELGSFDFSIAAEHELVGKYNTSFENQMDNGDGTLSTAMYAGHNVFNTRVTINYRVLEFWIHALNISDERYAARASYNRFRNENSYTIGNPRAFHFGARYNF